MALGTPGLATTVHNTKCVISGVLFPGTHTPAQDTGKLYQSIEEPALCLKIFCSYHENINAIHRFGKKILSFLNLTELNLTQST